MFEKLISSQVIPRKGKDNDTQIVEKQVEHFLFGCSATLQWVTAIDTCSQTQQHWSCSHNMAAMSIFRFACNVYRLVRGVKHDLVSRHTQLLGRFQPTVINGGLYDQISKLYKLNVMLSCKLWWSWCDPRDCGSLQLRHNGLEGVLNHQPRDCLLNRLFRRRSKKTSKPCVTGMFAGN